MFHVLLRHLTPRHPPYALGSFLHVMRRSSSSTCRYAVGKVRVRACAQTPERLSRSAGVGPRVPPQTCVSRLDRRSTTNPPRLSLVLAAKQPGASPGCRSATACRDRSSCLIPFYLPGEDASECLLLDQTSGQGLCPGGDEGARTPDIRLAKAALSQLSYIPIHWHAG